MAARKAPQSLKLVLIDDDEPARELLRRFIERHDEIEIVGEAGTCSKALDLVASVAFDAIYLDIRLGDGTGFDVLMSMRDRSTRAEVVFTSAYDAYAVRAFDLAAVDYLLKPFDERRFDESIARLRQRTAEDAPTPDASVSGAACAADTLLLRSAGRFEAIPLDAIEYIEASGDHAIVRTALGEVFSSEGLKALELSLPAERFVRVHRSAIVAIRAVRSFSREGRRDWRVQLESGARVKVGRSFVDTLRERFARVESRRRIQ